MPKMALTIGLVLLAMVFYVLGTSFLPKTEGFSKPLWTLACAGFYILGLFTMSRLIVSGFDIGVLVPLLSAGVPLIIVLISVIVYKQPTSPLKFGLLAGACMVIGVASKMA